MPLPLIPIAMGLAEMFAPALLSKLVGEKAGDVAKQVIDIGKQVTGLSDPTKLTDAIYASPEFAAKFKTDMATLKIERDRIDLENTKDARSRDLKLRELGFDNHRANWLIAGDIIGLLGCLVLLGFMAWQEMQGTKLFTGVVWATLGGLAAHFANGLRDAHNFEFGSSRGSKMKSILKSGD